MPPKIRQLAKNILRDPVEINVAISKPNEAIVQSAYICYEPQKMGIIEDLFQNPPEVKRHFCFIQTKSERFGIYFEKEETESGS